MQYDVAVLNGRFRPFTKAHLEGVVRPALGQAEFLQLNIGSCFAPRSIRNPWIGAEVECMIRDCLTQSENDRVIINRLPDFLYQDAKWIEEVQKTVVQNFGANKKKVALAGHSKDATSYYLKLFPMWDCIELPNYKGINATDVRANYFTRLRGSFNSFRHDFLTKSLPDAVVDYLYDWELYDWFGDILEEIEFVKQYRKEWGEGPFLTGDGVVLQGGHVLMIRRKNRPGKGLWALPGGFMNKGETLIESATRETYEETLLDMPRAAFAGSFLGGQTFDLPYRDPRARIITYAALFDLTKELDRKASRRQPSKALELTRVKGADDAAEAAWIPLSLRNSEEIYADHNHIIDKLISTYL